MLFHGIEVDMLSVGNADCILVTQWDAPTASWRCVLIDGGNKGDIDKLRAHLRQRNINF